MTVRQRRCRRFELGLALVPLALMLLALLPAIPVPADVAAADDPMAVARAGVDETIAIFRNPSMTLAVRRERLREVADRFIDFNDMSRSVLGYHWRELTPAQRAEFVPLFTGFIQDALLSRLHQSTVERIRQGVASATVTFTRERFDGPDYAEVFTSVLVPTAQQDPLQVTLMMHRTGTSWRCYDITVDAISVISNYRNQFNRVINEQGFPRLVEDLKLKRAAFEQEMSRPEPSS
ncbi:MAG TPA: ABC transporter substrate-binding protein [Candidatus Binataceae bacterium]|nr:ABC transporter substrate-binding protein [Candidatus Binataceae bacterium]